MHILLLIQGKKHANRHNFSYVFFLLYQLAHTKARCENPSDSTRVWRQTEKSSKNIFCLWMLLIMLKEENFLSRCGNWEWKLCCERKISTRDFELVGGCWWERNILILTSYDLIIWIDKNRESSQIVVT